MNLSFSIPFWKNWHIVLIIFVFIIIIIIFIIINVKQTKYSGLKFELSAVILAWEPGIGEVNSYHYYYHNYHCPSDQLRDH